MALRQRNNYLLSNRKRLALSQVDVAYLVGAANADAPCRHERLLRNPTLETALAYEVIYKRVTSEIFDGLYRKIEKEVAARAKALAEKADGRKSCRSTAQRRQMLLEIAGTRITSFEK